MFKILLTIFTTSILFLSQQVCSDTFRSRQNLFADSTVLITYDSLSCRVNDTGVVNVSNLIQYINSNPSATQISISFNGSIDNNPGYNNKFIAVISQAAGVVNYQYRKYTAEITGPHYVTFTLPTSNYTLEIYIKHFVNSRPAGFIKLTNIVIRRLF